TAVRYNTAGFIYYPLDHVTRHEITFYTRRHGSPFAISETVPGSAAGKSHLLCELSPESAASVTREQRQDLTTLFLDRARRLQPDLADQGVSHWIEDMLPLFYPGYIAWIRRFHDYQRRVSQRVYLCGDYL